MNKSFMNIATKTNKLINKLINKKKYLLEPKCDLFQVYYIKKSISIINHVNKLKKEIYLNTLSQKNITHIHGINSEQIRNRDFFKLINNIH